MTGKLKTAILGATGYSGFELARILLRHPQVETPSDASAFRRATAANLADMYPAISGNGGYPMQPLSWSELQRQKSSSCFWLRLTRFQGHWFQRRSPAGLRVVDLSGAWRLHKAQNRAIYGFQDANAQPQPSLRKRQFTAFLN